MIRRTQKFLQTSINILNDRLVKLQLSYHIGMSYPNYITVRDYELQKLVDLTYFNNNREIDRYLTGLEVGLKIMEKENEKKLPEHR